MCQSLDFYLCRRRTGFCFVPSQYRIPNIPILYSLFSQIAQYCNFALARTAYGRPPTCATQKHAHAVAHRLSHQDVRAVSQRLWLGTVTGWVLDFPASAVVTCQRRKLLGATVCFLIAHAGHQHSDSDFVNDVRLSQNSPHRNRRWVLSSTLRITSQSHFQCEATANSEQSRFIWMI